MNAWVLLAVALLLTSTSGADAKELSALDRAVVRITTSGTAAGGSQVSQVGSGFLISGDGYVLTAAHVVNPRNGDWEVGVNGPVRDIKVEWQSPNGIWQSAFLLSARTLVVRNEDRNRDVALLKINGNFDPHFEVCDVDVQTDDSIVGFGVATEVNPYHAAGTVRRVGDAGHKDRTSIVIPFRPGDSGGPITDSASRSAWGVFVEGDSVNPNLGYVEPVRRAQIAAWGIALPACSAGYGDPSFRRPSCIDRVLDVITAEGIEISPGPRLKAVEVCFREDPTALSCFQDVVGANLQTNTKVLTETRTARSLSCGAGCIDGRGAPRDIVPITITAEPEYTIASADSPVVKEQNGSHGNSAITYERDADGRVSQASVTIWAQSEAKPFGAGAWYTAEFKVHLERFYSVGTLRKAAAACERRR